MKTLPAANLTPWVSLVALCLATPALADDQPGPFYNMACASQQGQDTWTLSLSTMGDHVAELWRDSGNPRVRIGTYDQTGDDVVAHLEDITTLHLHVAWGNASWSAGDAKGTFLCRYAGDQQLARWQDQPPVYALAPEPDPSSAEPQQPPNLAPPPVYKSAVPAGEKICDMQGVCYGSGGGSNGTGNNHASVPVEVEGEQAFVQVHIGRLSFRSLIDSGATSMSLPETAAQELLDSGDATEGDTVSVSLADGRSHTVRTVILKQIRIGSHSVNGVLATVEGDGAPVLLGFKILRQFTGRFTVDVAGSELRFE